MATNLQLAGLLLVLGVLAYLCLAVSRLSRALRSLQQRAPAPALAPAGPAAPAIDEGVVAAIAAAGAVVIRGRHRIVAVQAETSAQRAWSAEGRREIYLSHRVR